jgi:hypothetical protein
MSLFELIIFLLIATCGLVFTIVHAEIMDILKIRPFLQKSPFIKKVIKCSLCTGVYIGFALGLLFLPLIFIIPFAFAASGVAFIYERTVYLLDEHIIQIAKNDKTELIAKKILR